MKNYETKTIEVEEKTLKSITCDSCKKEYNDVYDTQEFLFINFVGGYGSVFGDGNEVEGDICQYCVKELLGSALRINKDYDRT